MSFLKRQDQVSKWVMDESSRGVSVLFEKIYLDQESTLD
jgi:hypothetical protein